MGGGEGPDIHCQFELSSISGYLKVVDFLIFLIDFFNYFKLVVAFMALLTLLSVLHFLWVRLLFLECPFWW